jgi:DNA-binding transcriptional LysR family regulator
MNLNHVALFLAVAEEGSVSRGAERLCISQPAVSKQLAELESALGSKLFDRLPRGVRLTEAGEVLLPYARRLFAVEREAETVLAELRGLERGRLAVGASTTLGSYVLPGILAAFKRRHPGIDLHLVIDNADGIRDALLDGALDVGLTEGRVDAPEIEAEVFMEDEIVAIAATDHPLLAEAPVMLERLAREPFVVREAGSGTRAVAERALGERGLSVRPVLTLGSTEAVKRAVFTGIGVAFVSGLAVGLDREAGRLAVVPLSDLTLRRPLLRIRLRSRSESPAMVAFRERMRRSLNSRSWKAYQGIE